MPTGRAETPSWAVRGPDILFFKGSFPRTYLVHLRGLILPLLPFQNNWCLRSKKAGCPQGLTAPWNSGPRRRIRTWQLTSCCPRGSTWTSLCPEMPTSAPSRRYDLNLKTNPRSLELREKDEQTCTHMHSLSDLPSSNMHFKRSMISKNCLKTCWWSPPSIPSSVSPRIRAHPSACARFQGGVRV